MMPEQTGAADSARPTAGATYERACRFANASVWAIDLQVRRLNRPEAEDSEFHFRLWSDFDFLVVALSRLRRAVSLAAQLPQFRLVLSASLATFDSALPHLKQFRDVAEHFDDYAIDRGRNQAVKRQELEVSSLGSDGPTVSWMGHSLNARCALDASVQLHRDLCDAKHLVAPGA
jgi:hypothetical protein